MTPAGIKPAMPASELPQTHAVDRAATGIGVIVTESDIARPDYPEINP